ncbi:zinc finger protein OZF-like isoform X2 [Phlebotomus papatasi]|uniref:zinc finger protein OZF-like isoform X2 n=1 Tax=Phlebotomus papatasi TaxID=29031 RepID=UPI00248351D2|nr:zinc finger protein OZF-like isoform X2 [Phlebotomus papatasi]XP_055709620.1 zinc finger protein OZF-like isoform X2 [Phlebotomus papatasi]
MISPEQKNIHNNWLRFICGSCKNKLESLWEFKILCKNAYRKYLDELDEDNCDFNSFGAYESEDAFKDNDLDSKNIITKLESEEDNRMHSQTFEMVLVPEEGSEDAKNSVEKYLKEDDVKEVKTSEVNKTKEPKKKKGKKSRKRGQSRKQKHSKESKVDPRQYFPILPGPYFCGHCNKSFVRKANVRQHIITVHREFLKFLCNACGRKFSSRYKLSLHESVHVENRVRVPCNICKETFITPFTLKRHIKLMHENVTQRELNHYFRCKICNVATEGRNAHYEHLKMHPEVTIFKCRFCRKELNSLEAYAQHENIHFVERPYICEICSKSFKQNTHLTRHMNIHTLAKKYPCNFCGKIFTQASNRKTHLRIHTGEPAFECINCLKRFAERKEWKNHCKSCPKV